MSVRDFLRLLLGSSISLIILLLIITLLMGMEQGLTIVVSLYYSPVWLCVTVLMINFLALILSHFPYYFDLAIKDVNHRIDWTYAKRFLFLRYFYHEDLENTSSVQSESDSKKSITPEKTFNTLKDKWLVSFFRRHIGVLCYNIFFAILVYVNSSIFNISNSDTCDDFGSKDVAYIIISILIFLLVHLLIFMYFNKINDQLYNKSSNKMLLSDLKDNIRLILLIFNVFLIVDVVLIILLYYLAQRNGWSRINLLLLMGICQFNTILYILFRLIRPWFIYYFKDDRHQCDNNDYPKKKIEDFYIKSWFSFLAHLSSTPNYLAAMGAFGMLVVFGILLPGIFSDAWIQQVHPIPLLLAIIIFYYSAVVIVLKFIIYLNSKIARGKEDERFSHKLRLWVVYSLLIMGSIILFVLADSDNDLHTLPLVQKEKNSSIENYLNGIDSSDTYFILGSYGGGLKANSWNMMLLEEINREVPDFFKRTLCLSGVSGGAIGIANFVAMQYHHKQADEETKDSIIFDIANANMLSNDIFGLFIKDFWREFIPGQDIFNGDDRANVSMEIYSKAFGCKKEELITSMSDYWLKAKADEYFPAIIFNTTPTTSDYGVACSVDDVHFYNSLDILDHSYLKGHNKSLSFFGAASTANRFPFFSPAARITRKGHFVDGGYFENSGLINGLAFYDHVQKSFIDQIHELKVVNIVNDKNLYILDVLRTYNLTISDNAEQHEAEWSAVLKGLLALERMPRYLKSKLKSDSIYIISLHMPYIFNMEDLKTLFRVHDFEDKTRAKLQMIINENRNTIKGVLTNYLESGRRYELENWGVVTPPLGRLLSEPAVLYQKAMIKGHPFLLKEMGKLK